MNSNEIAAMAIVVAVGLGLVGFVATSSMGDKSPWRLILEGVALLLGFTIVVAALINLRGEINNDAIFYVLLGASTIFVGAVLADLIPSVVKEISEGWAPNQWVIRVVAVSALAGFSFLMTLWDPVRAVYEAVGGSLLFSGWWIERKLVLREPQPTTEREHLQRERDIKAVGDYLWLSLTYLFVIAAAWMNPDGLDWNLTSVITMLFLAAAVATLVIGIVNRARRKDLERELGQTWSEVRQARATEARERKAVGSPRSSR